MWRNCVLFLVFGCVGLFYSSNVNAQGISIGYRSHMGGMGAYKGIVNFYNDNRPWLDNEFSTTGYMHGFEIGLSGQYDNLGMSAMKLSLVFSKTRAKGTFNNETYNRTLRSRIFGLELFDIWYTPIHIGEVNIGGGVMPLGLGRFRTRTWLKGEKTENIPLSDLEKHNLAFVKTFHMYACPHLDFTINTEGEQFFHVQIFYTLGPKREYNLYYLNAELNPSTHGSFNQRTLLKINNAGLKLSYSF